MARALKTLVGKDLPRATREKYLRRIYDLTTRDDVALLDELGLLEEVDPERGPTEPRDLPPGARGELADRVEELRQRPKRPYFVADAARDGSTARRGSRPRSNARKLRRLVRKD